MRVPAACVLPLVCGCAYLSVEPATGPDDPGVHFFLPKPYLLVSWERPSWSRSTSPDVLAPRGEIIYLPDVSQRYVITQRVFLAKADFAYALKDGWMLGSVNGGMDTSEFIRAAKEIGVAAIETSGRRSAAPADGTETRIPTPVLYEPIWSAAKRTYQFRAVRLEPPGQKSPPGCPLSP